VITKIPEKPLHIVTIKNYKNDFMSTNCFLSMKYKNANVSSDMSNTSLQTIRNITALMLQNTKKGD